VTAGRAEFERHVAAIRACTLCATVVGPPIVGPVWGAEIMLVGQAPGPREGDLGRPFAWTAGRTLFRWFERLGADEERFRSRVHVAAVVRCFPGRAPQGGDRVPSRDEVSTCFAYCRRDIELLRPRLILPVGRLAIDQFLEAPRLAEVIGGAFEQTLHGVRATVIPLPHPSGRSTWATRPAHRQLLDTALARIGRHPAWRRTFDQRAPAG